MTRRARQSDSAHRRRADAAAAELSHRPLSAQKAEGDDAALLFLRALIEASTGTDTAAVLAWMRVAGIQLSDCGLSRGGARLPRAVERAAMRWLARRLIVGDVAVARWWLEQTVFDGVRSERAHLGRRAEP